MAWRARSAWRGHARARGGWSWLAAVLAPLFVAPSPARAVCPPGWQLVSSTGPSARAYAAMAYDPDHQRVLSWGGYDGANFVNDFWSWNGTTWSSIPGSGPPPFFQGVATYDRSRSRFVLFVHGETWEWDGVSWSLASTAGPVARVDACMAYDEQRHVTVLFGGYDYDSNSDPSDTWEWDGATWQQRSLVGPGGRQGARMAYHAGLHRVVMFGGTPGVTFDDQLWSWDGSTWSVLAAGGPPGRQLFEFAYDRARDRLLVAGGENLTPALKDTWEWDGVNWNVVANPSAATDAGSACFDEARGETVQIGGYNASEVLVRQTWTWRGGDPAVRGTTNLLPTALGQPATLQVVASGTAPLVYQWRHAGIPLADDGHYSGTSTATLSIPAVAASDTGTYDAVVSSACTSVIGPGLRLCSNPLFIRQPFGLFGALGVGLTFSVQAGGCAVTSYEWQHDGVPLLNGGRISGATSPTLTIASSIAADAGSYRCVVDNTAGSSVTASAPVELSSCLPSWTQHVVSGPAGTSDGAMVYDSFRHRAVLFGGTANSPNTWEWDGTQWQLVSSTGPGARWGPAMAYDAIRHRVVLFGGYNDVTGHLGDTWEWDGVTWTLRANGGPVPRVQSAMVFDGTRCILFGGSPASGGVLADTWSWDGTTWQQLASSGPRARANHAMAYDPVRGRVLVFGGWTLPSAWLSDAWTWDGATWSPVDRTGPGTREGAAAAFDAARQRIVLFGGYTGFNNTAECWEWDGSSWLKSLVPGGPAGLFDPAMAYDGDHGTIVLFGGRFNNDTESSQTWTRAGSGVIITQAPSSATVSAGSDAVFTVTAAGTPPLAYHWRKDGATLTDGGNVSGSGTGTLTLSAVQPPDAGSYQVVVSGTCGTATASATLDVPCSPARQITTQPSDVTVPLGSPASFQVAAVGCAPVSYRWRKNGVDLTGATSALFSIAAVTLQDAGTYSCLVSDGLGSTASAIATLNLQEPVLLSRTERIVSTTQAQVLWETRSDCTAIVQYGATSGLGSQQGYPIAAKTGSAVLGRGPASTLYYRLVLTDLSARTLTTSTRQVVFPPSGARLSVRLIPANAYVDWNGAAQGISIGASFKNMGTGNSGPLILDSAFLNAAPARSTNGQPSTPRQVTPDLAPGASVQLVPDLVFSRSELALPPGAFATATINIHWTDGLFTRTLQVKQRVRLP